MRIAICEDDVNLCSQIADFLKEEALENSTCRQIKAYHSGDSFWFDYQDSSKPFDLILLDIELPGTLNGLEVAKRIRNTKDNVAIVIITAFTKYALAGYNVQPFDYLVKPVKKKQLLDIVHKVETRLRLYWNNCLNLPKQGGFLRISFDDILYLESRGHNVFIHTREEKHKLYRKLDDILELCDERFISTHKSYAVNADFIKQIENKYTEIILQDGKDIPISQQKKSCFTKALAKYDRMCVQTSAMNKGNTADYKV